MTESLLTQHIDLWTSAIEAKSTAGRGSKNKFDLYGIKKLRELILELAVRGKLVPQDLTDEPTSVLLEKIAIEKVKQIKDKKVKKSDLLPEILDGDINFKLPQNWEWIRLGDIVEVIRGITFPSSEKSKSPQEGRVACLRTANVQDEIQWDDMLFIRSEFVKREEQFIKKNDLVMSMANSRELVGKVALIKKEPDNMTAFGGFLSVLRSNCINQKFLMSLLRAPTNKNILIESASQTTNIANISLAKLNPLILAIPPIEEQHRIVAKVDELMALCDQLEQQTLTSIDAHATLVETLLETLTNSADAAELEQNWARISEHFDTLFTTEQSIDALKQTILQLAVMGKLVRQDPTDEPASVLLEKIAAEKAQLIKDKKIRKQDSLPVITDEEKYFSLPEGWSWCRLDDICYNITSGSTPSKEYFTSENGIPYLKVYNIRDQLIDFEYQPQFVTKECHEGKLKRSTLLPGDVVMNIVGPPLGKTAIIPDTYPEWNCNQAITFFRSIEKDINPFIYLYIRAGLFLSFIELIGTAGQDNISVTKSRTIVLPLPPLAEQVKIMEKAYQLLRFCDDLTSRLKKYNQTLIHMTDAFINTAL